VEDVSGPDAIDDATLVVLPSWPTDLPATEESLARRIRAARDKVAGSPASAWAPSQWSTAVCSTAATSSPTGVPPINSCTGAELRRDPRDHADVLSTALVCSYTVGDVERWARVAAADDDGCALA